jgi:hypothetical protein
MDTSRWPPRPPHPRRTGCTPGQPTGNRSAQLTEVQSRRLGQPLGRRGWKKRCVRHRLAVLDHRAGFLGTQEPLRLLAQEHQRCQGDPQHRNPPSINRANTARATRRSSHGGLPDFLPRGTPSLCVPGGNPLSPRTHNERNHYDIQDRVRSHRGRCRRNRLGTLRHRWHGRVCRSHRRCSHTRRRRRR